MPFSPTRARSLNIALSTARLRLEPLVASDAALMFERLRRPELYDWISAEPPASVAALTTRWQRNESRLSPGGDAAWLGWTVARGGEVVGKLDAEVTTGEIASNVGYIIFVEHWGKGFASEAVRALSDHLVAAGVREQHATVTVGNDASCRVLEKCGFERRTTLPRNDTIRGVACDDYAYVRRG